MSSPETDLLLQLAGLQADASQYRAEFEKNLPEERRDWIQARTMMILNGGARFAPHELSAIGGFEVDPARYPNLFVGNLLSAINVLQALSAYKKTDKAPYEFKDNVQAMNPYDQQAFNVVAWDFDWQKRENEAPVHGRLSLLDYAIEMLDVRNIAYQESQVEVGEGSLLKNRHSARLGNSRGLKNILFRSLKRQLGLKPADYGTVFPRPELTEPDFYHTSLVVPAEGKVLQPVEQIFDPDYFDPREVGLQRFYDALDPLFSAAEALVAYTGDRAMAVQNVEPWAYFPGLRDLMTGGQYHEKYSTLRHHTLEIFGMSEIYTGHLNKMLPDGIETFLHEHFPQIFDQDNPNYDRRAAERAALKRCYTIPRLLDAAAAAVVVSDGNPQGVRDLWRDTTGRQRIKRLRLDPRVEILRPDLNNPEEPIVSARPIGTFGRVARRVASENPALFDGIDFSLALGDGGVKGEWLREIQGRNEHIGIRGFISLMEHVDGRMFVYPNSSRAARNYPHYWKSVEDTMMAIGLDAPRAANEIVIPLTVLEGSKEKGLITGRETKDSKWLTVKAVEMFSFGLIHEIKKALAGRDGTKPWSFTESPELTSILERALMTIISGHFVYPTNRPVADSQALRELRERYPAVGKLVDVDWENYFQRRAKQSRPQRMTEEELARVAGSTEQENQLRQALMDEGFYWMVWGSDDKTQNIPRGGSVSRKEPKMILISPYQEAVYSRTDNVGYFREWGETLRQIHEVDPTSEERWGNYQRLQEAGFFAPVHMYGDAALPAILWKHLIEGLEGSGGIQFLESGSLAEVRWFIEKAAEAGLLAPYFTFIHPRLVSLQNQTEGQEILRSKVVEGTDPFARYIPDHLKHAFFPSSTGDRLKAVVAVVNPFKQY